MEIQTSRFGKISVDDDRIITVRKGLLGFPSFTRYALIQGGTEHYFLWLQSVEEPNLAFLVTDPSLFFKDYQVPVWKETAQELQLADPSHLQVFVICNKVGEWLTGNLLGPLLVNAQNHLAQQVVLTEKKWTTRQPLLRVGMQELPLAKPGITSPLRTDRADGLPWISPLAPPATRMSPGSIRGGPRPGGCDCQAAASAGGLERCLSGPYPGRSQSMLVLSRQRDETIMIGDDIEVTVVDIRGDKVRLGINAPKEISVHRKEVYDAIRRENRAAAQVKPEDVSGIGRSAARDRSRSLSPRRKRKSHDALRLAICNLRLTSGRRNRERKSTSRYAQSSRRRIRNRNLAWPHGLGLAGRAQRIARSDASDHGGLLCLVSTRTLQSLLCPAGPGPARSMCVVNTTLQRLSTGLRINSGADDPSGLIASQRPQEPRWRASPTAISNSQRANNVIATAEGALNEVSSLLQSVKGLVVQAANTGAMSADEIAANQLQLGLGVREHNPHQRDDRPLPGAPGLMEALGLPDQRASNNKAVRLLVHISAGEPGQPARRCRCR